MLAAGTRSDLIETLHDGAVAIFDADRNLTARSGEIDRPYYLRSSAKPFQAFIAQQAGANLLPVQLALASASHDGFPVHVGIVEEMLREAGLGDVDLQCPPDWPLGESAQRRLVAVGHQAPRRVWHNCSGKHAAWLRACKSQGWPTVSYLAPDHPLQIQIQDLVSELGEHPTRPVGIDGCGAPVLRTTVRAMALMFSKLATEDRFTAIFEAMHRYPALVSGVGNGDAAIAIATNSVAKRGAAGCIGIALGRQFGVAVKSWDGRDDVAALAAAASLDFLGVIPDGARPVLEQVMRPPVLGGEEAVGHLESKLELLST